MKIGDQILCVALLLCIGFTALVVSVIPFKFDETTKKEYSIPTSGNQLPSNQSKEQEK